MPRRYAEYLPKFQVENVISTIGSACSPSDLVMCWNFLQGSGRGSRLCRSVAALSLEWRPPPPRDGEFPRNPGGDRMAVRLRDPKA